MGIAVPELLCTAANKGFLGGFIALGKAGVVLAEGPAIMQYKPPLFVAGSETEKYLYDMHGFVCPKADQQLRSLLEAR